MRLPDLLATFALAAAAAAQGVHATSCAVAVDVVDGVATTTLALTLHNPTARPAEADWVLPLPDGAAADRFTMTIDGKEQAGAVLDADRARGVYETIVRSRRDPGLLEHFGRGCLRARIFPIAPQGDTKVVVRYAHVLPVVGALRRFTFPLRVCGVGGASPQSATLDVRIRDATPIRNLLSPDAQLHTALQGPHEARASFEPRPGEALPAALRLFYGVDARDLGIDLLTWRAADQDGCFLLLVTPDPAWQEDRALPRSITFVLDVSGSMAGAPLEQAQGALRCFLRTLQPRDRFDVVTFSSDAEKWFGVPVSATPENVAKAEARIAALQARGGTNIEAALLAAVRAPVPAGSLPLVVFVTDGQPNVGVTGTKDLLAVVRAANPHGVRVHVLGVSDAVNSVLLDSLAEQHAGTRHYVRPNEDLEARAGELLHQLALPVLAGVTLQVDGVELRALAPPRLPDLFRGSRVAISGRYRGHGKAVVTLRGVAGGKAVEHRREVAFPARAGEHEFVRTLWAQRRTGWLLDEIRRNGEARELVEEVTALGREHRIVTPYTSHLVVEESLRALAGPPPRGGGTATPGPGGPSVPGPSGPATVAAPGRGSHPAPAARGPSTGPRGLNPGVPPGAGGAPLAGPGDQVPGDDWIYAGESRRADRAASRPDVVGELQAAGLLPAQGSREDLARLAAQIVQELRQLERGATAAETGKDAIDASVYLTRLMHDTSAGGLGERFVRRVGGRTFQLRAGTWTDVALRDGMTRTRIEAFGKEYFALVQAHPELAPCLAFSTRLVVVAGDRAFEIVPG
jgi:Ca-activated chloride channel family protein